MNVWLVCGLMVTSGLLAQQASNTTPATVIETPAAAPMTAAPSTPALGAPAPAAAGTNAPSAKAAKKKTGKKKAPKGGAKKKSDKKAVVKKPEAKPAPASGGAAAELKTTPLSPGPATVIAGHVNVRGQANLKGEVIGHLAQGDTVTVIEEIALKKSGPDEPSAWAKINLPSTVHTWINAGFVDANKTIKAKRLNLRGGPGENYSVLGRIEQGDTVKEVATKGDWMEIEAPTNAYAFVAAVYLKQAEAPAATTPSVASTTPPVTATPPTTTPPTPTVTPAATTPAPETTATAPVVTPGPAVAVTTPPVAPVSPLTEIPRPAVPTPVTTAPVVTTTTTPPPTEPPTTTTVTTTTPEVTTTTTTTTPTPSATEPTTPAVTTPVTTEPSPAVANPTEPAAATTVAKPEANTSEPKPEEPLPPRIVQREGLVRGMTSIQAPSKYALISVDTGKNIDYLYTTSTNRDLGRYKGAHVIVVGEEGLDARWGNTPVIDIHRLIVLKDAGL